jgi:hypothetical protein
MYDSITSSGIPTDARLVAGYADGRFAWTAADWKLFPNAIHVPIAVFSTTNAGLVGDSEPGDMTPAGLVRWVKMRRAAGVDPTGYCSEGSFNQNGVTYGWAACRAAFAAAAEPEPHWWVAAYPGGGAVIPAGAVAHQYSSTANYDISVVADHWPGVDPEVDVALTQDDANLVAATLLNYYIVTPNKPAGSSGRQVWDVLGDGERTQAAMAALSGVLSSEQAALLTAIKAQPTGGQVDVKTLADALAPALVPLLPANATPQEFGQAVVAALDAQLSK